MTSEEKKIYDAAVVYSARRDTDSLGRLVTAVMDLPLNQWPEVACNAAEHKKRKTPLSPLIVHRGPKLEEGDTANPDKIISLETGEKKLP